MPAFFEDKESRQRKPLGGKTTLSPLAGRQRVIGGFFAYERAKPAGISDGLRAGLAPAAVVAAAIVVAAAAIVVPGAAVVAAAADEEKDDDDNPAAVSAKTVHKRTSFD